MELPNTVEGLVRLSDLEGDYYVFDEKRYQLKGERTGKTYKLGQRIKVTVAGTDRLPTVDLPFTKTMACSMMEQQKVPGHKGG